MHPESDRILKAIHSDIIYLLLLFDYLCLPQLDTFDIYESAPRDLSQQCRVIVVGKLFALVGVKDLPIW